MLRRFHIDGMHTKMMKLNRVINKYWNFDEKLSKREYRTWTIVI